MYTGVHILPRPPFRRNALENPIGLLSDMARNLRRLSLGKPPPPRSPPPPPRCRPLPPRCRPARPRGPRIGCRPAACPAGGALGGRPAAGRRPENGQNATGSLSGRRGPPRPVPYRPPRRAAGPTRTAPRPRMTTLTNGAGGGDGRGPSFPQAGGGRGRLKGGTFIARPRS